MDSTYEVATTGDIEGMCFADSEAVIGIERVEERDEELGRAAEEELFCELTRAMRT